MISNLLKRLLAKKGTREYLLRFRHPWEGQELGVYAKSARAAAWPYNSRYIDSVVVVKTGERVPQIFWDSAIAPLEKHFTDL